MPDAVCGKCVCQLNNATILTKQNKNEPTQKTNTESTVCVRYKLAAFFSWLIISSFCFFVATLFCFSISLQHIFVFWVVFFDKWQVSIFWLLLGLIAQRDYRCRVCVFGVVVVGGG